MLKKLIVLIFVFLFCGSAFCAPPSSDCKTNCEFNGATLTINSTTLDVNGDLKFATSGAGLPYGGMYTNTQITVTIANTNPTEIKNATSDGFTVGILNGVTFPTDGDEHYLEIDTIGVYECVWSVSVAMASASGAREIEGGCMLNGTAQGFGQAHRTVQSSTDTGNMGGNCLIDVTSVDQQISLFIKNSDTTPNLNIEHADIICKQLGGT